VKILTAVWLIGIQLVRNAHSFFPYKFFGSKVILHYWMLVMMYRYNHVDL